MNVKTCSNCDITKDSQLFIKNRNVCKECSNSQRREHYKNHVEESTENGIKNCIKCGLPGGIDDFHKNRNACKKCVNEKRREKYHTDEELRRRSIESSLISKRKKSMARQEELRRHQEEIGIGNKQCRYCNQIKLAERFRHNRMKCRDCERDEPMAKFIRIVRSRIYGGLNSKTKNTIEYLGCSNEEYAKWILNYNEQFTLENRGTVWHIDHVLPLSSFDLNDEEQQKIAFNWRNTMPLLASENLSKNNKIIIEQVKTHWNKVVEYHNNNNTTIPQNIESVYAKYLDAGNPLEPLLPPVV